MISRTALTCPCPPHYEAEWVFKVTLDAGCIESRHVPKVRRAVCIGSYLRTLLSQRFQHQFRVQPLSIIRVAVSKQNTLILLSP